MKRASDPTTHDTSVFSGTRPTEDLSTWQGTKFIHKFKKKKNVEWRNGQQRIRVLKGDLVDDNKQKGKPK
jgi:hypothetical protein